MTGSPELGRETIMGWVKLALCVKISKTVRRYVQSYYYMDWIVQCFTSPSTQYRLYGRRSVTITDW